MSVGGNETKERWVDGLKLKERIERIKDAEKDSRS